jgi:hypothetical protein
MFLSVNAKQKHLQSRVGNGKETQQLICAQNNRLESQSKKAPWQDLTKQAKITLVWN